MLAKEAFQGELRSEPFLPSRANEASIRLLIPCESQNTNPCLYVLQVFFYPVEEDLLPGVPQATRHDLSRAIRSNGQSTSNADEACIFVRFISAEHKKPDLFSLKYWNGDGANHVIVILDNSTRSNNDYGFPLSDGKAIYARQTFRAEQFRDQFDIVLPVGARDGV